jgi:hypothetical protein
MPVQAGVQLVRPLAGGGGSPAGQEMTLGRDLGDLLRTPRSEAALTHYRTDLDA